MNCPNCEGKNVEFQVVVDGITDEAEQKNICLDCGTVWYTPHFDPLSKGEFE